MTSGIPAHSRGDRPSANSREPAPFAGVDWGSQKHQACVLDAAGNVLGEREFEHGGAGLSQMADWLLSFAAGAEGEVGVAIETPRGPVVESLMERGFAVHSINPVGQGRGGGGTRFATPRPPELVHRRPGADGFGATKDRVCGAAELLGLPVSRRAAIGPGGPFTAAARRLAGGAGALPLGLRRCASCRSIPGPSSADHLFITTNRSPCGRRAVRPLRPLRRRACRPAQRTDFFHGLLARIYVGSFENIVSLQPSV